MSVQIWYRMFVCVFKLIKTEKMCECLCKEKIEWWGVVFSIFVRIWLKLTAGQMLFWHFATHQDQNTGLEQNRECESSKYAFHEEKLDRKLEEKQLWRLDKICNTIWENYDLVEGWCISLEPCAPKNVHTVQPISQIIQELNAFQTRHCLKHAHTYSQYYL